MSKIYAQRYHDISCGHRVVGHESKCRYLHGHNYRFHFTIEATQLDSVGRVLDFSVIKSILCQWIEKHYDHRFLIWKKDPLLDSLNQIDPESLYVVGFNPTAENIAQNFVENIAPVILPENVRLVELRIEETRKCSAIYSLK